MQARADVAKGHGYLVTPTVKTRRNLGGGLSLAGSILGTYASEDYMAAYFGIDVDDAARSGLNQFDADAEFKDVGADRLLAWRR